MDNLISTLFDADDTIKDMNCDPSGFIKKARSIDEGFEWESDVMNLVIETRDKERRRRLIAEKYAEASFDGLLKTSLHPYQAEGVRFAFSEGRTINADETGRVTGYKNLHSVAERLSRRLIRRRKAEVRLQMPARTDTNLFVPMIKEQQAIHDDYKFQVGVLIHKWHRFKFLSEADRKRLLLFLSMMRMVCDNTFILDQKSRHDSKIEEIMAIIANMLAGKDGKVVIFSQWERMLRILASELERDDIDFCFLHGGVPSPKRKDLICNRQRRCKPSTG